LRDAIGLLEQAVRLDPKFTLAYCASAQTHGLLYFRYPSPERRAMGDAAIANALRLQPDLPEVRLAYAFQLYFCYGYPDYERIREQLAIAKRGLTNSAEVFRLEAWMDRRQGKWEKAIQDLNEAIARDPRNILSIHDLADTTELFGQYSASEKAFDRLIDLLPDWPMIKVEKTVIPALAIGDEGPARSAITALPASMANDAAVLTFRLNLALTARDWRQGKEIIEKFNGGEDNNGFAYGRRPIPANCYSILIARLQGERPRSNSGFTEVREQLNQNVQKSPENANLLSNLAVVDALLDNKKAAIAEAKRAVEILPISKDAMDGPAVMTNLALVYAWTD
jgi:tetratricopeptide (TPR) repeat protein